METQIVTSLRSFSAVWNEHLVINPTTMQAQGLAGINAKYLSLEEFVLEHGQQFDATDKHPLSKRYRLGECYENSWNFLCERCNSLTNAPTKYTYVEGFAMDNDCPVLVLHGWVVTNDGKVIDPTWGWKPNVEYYGIPFDWRFMNKTLGAIGMFGLIANSETQILKGNWKCSQSRRFPNKSRTDKGPALLVL